MAKVLIVEDDRVIAEGMARHLSSAGFDPVLVGKSEQGLARLAEHPAGVFQVEQGRADAILAHRANTMSQEQPAGFGFERCTAVANLDHFPVRDNKGPRKGKGASGKIGD